MLLATLLLACSQTPAAETPLVLKPHWEIGPLLRLELVKGREDWEDDRLQKTSKTVTPIDVEVMAKGESGWVVRWTYGHTSIVEGADVDRDYAEHMASLNEGMKVDVRLTPAGAVDGLANPDGLKRHYSKMLQELERGLVEKGTDQRVVEAVLRDATRRVLGPDFERASLVEMELFQRCLTLPLVPGKKTEYEGELPNPFGGDPFPGLGTYQVDPLEPGKREATVRFTLAIDPLKTRDLIMAWMTELAKQSGKEPPKGPDDLPLKGLDESDFYLLDLDNALPIRVEHVRTTRIQKHRRIDRTFLRVLPQVAKPAPAGDKPR